MKNTLSIIGGLLLVLGAIWFLQGINVLPGSFMTGQTKWAVIGGGCFVAGLASLILSEMALKTVCLNRATIHPKHPHLCRPACMR